MDGTVGVLADEHLSAPIEEVRAEEPEDLEEAQAEYELVALGSGEKRRPGGRGEGGGRGSQGGASTAEGERTVQARKASG